MNRFLVYFTSELVSFRWPEIDSIVSLCKLSIKWRDKTSKPFAIVEYASEKDIRTLCSRSMLIKSAHELWCEGSTKAQLFQQMMNCSMMNLPQFAGKDRSFKITVQTFNRKTSIAERVAKIEEMTFLPFEGDIDLKEPVNDFTYVEYYHREQNSDTHADEPSEYFFGRFICRSDKRYNVHHFSLKDRKFISNTSMDPTLSSIMSNIARVKAGDLVLDPFVGSGSILVAAADMGAIVFGSDIDYKLLFGLSRPSRPNIKKRQVDETLLGNLSQYSLSSQYGDVILADASRPVVRSSLKFDSIICDPPYGIRESCERVGTQKKDFKIPDEMIARHFPAKVRYTLSDIIQDLLTFGCQSLAVGSRLVFWIPVFKDAEGSWKNPPDLRHACMRQVCSCEQELTRNTSRVLICMQKESDVCHCELPVTESHTGIQHSVTSTEEPDEVSIAMHEMILK